MPDKFNNESLKERHPSFTKKWQREMIGEGATKCCKILTCALTGLVLKLRKACADIQMLLTRSNIIGQDMSQLGWMIFTAFKYRD